MTGADWIRTRFGKGRGAHLAHIIVVIYAFFGIIGFFSYGFEGIGEFASTFLPWNLSPNQYALALIAITAIYQSDGVDSRPAVALNHFAKRRTGGRSSD
jgi:Na+/proline symporter